MGNPIEKTVVLGEIPDRCPKFRCQASKRLIIRSGFSGAIESLGLKRRQRFKCTQCGFRFSENHLKLHFRMKHPDPALNSNIFFLFIHGLSMRKLSRRLGVSVGSVRIRLFRMSQQALDFQNEVLKRVKIREPICYDGLENFAQSQYEPNYINQAVGFNSLFIYDFNFSGLNRKGRTSAYQKLKRDILDQSQGRFDPKAIRKATGSLFRRLCRLKEAEDPLKVFSDRHFQYRDAVDFDLRDLEIEHETISSKATRNYQNILFPVNHVDLLIRQALAAFSRETIAFSKTHGMMCQKYALFMVYKNYMAPQFTKKQVRRVNAHLESPAQKLKIVDRVLKFRDIFESRSQKENIETWNEDWKCFWAGEVPEKYRRIKKSKAA